jgi:hypothetical protein
MTDEVFEEIDREYRIARRREQAVDEAKAAYDAVVAAGGDKDDAWGRLFRTMMAEDSGADLDFRRAVTDNLYAVWEYVRSTRAASAGGASGPAT